MFGGWKEASAAQQRSSQKCSAVSYTIHTAYKVDKYLLQWNIGGNIGHEP